MFTINIPLIHVLHFHSIYIGILLVSYQHYQHQTKHIGIDGLGKNMEIGV